MQAGSSPDCKAVVRVITFDAKGDTLSQGQGFFCSEKGDVIAPYQLFRGATKAYAVDWKGGWHPVNLIMGASSTQDIVRLATSGKKMPYVSISTHEPTAQQVVMMPSYSTQKKAIPVEIKVTSAENFGSYKYCGISAPNEKSLAGCPLLNTDGQVVAIVQYNVERKATTACAIDARFVNDLDIKASSALNADLRAIQMPRAIPEDEDEAFSYIYMLHRVAQDSVQFVVAAQQFCSRYPKNFKGYTEIATFYASHNDYANADQAISAALALHTQEDEVRSTFSEIIYQKALYHPQPAYKDWTLEKALAECEQAYTIKPDTAYVLQRANCLFGLERYHEAYEGFLQAVKFSKRPAELYFYAANALERAGGESEKIIALLDSALNTFERPYSSSAAPYLLARAQRLEGVEKYRAAVMDYNEYEKAIGAKNLTARFYDIRQAVEQKARMYQQAIDDLGTAVVLSTTDNERALYQTEIAYIYLIVGMNQECVEAAQKALTYSKDFADTYKIMGIAYGEMGRKSDALSQLSRAQALGDEDAKNYIERYSK